MKGKADALDVDLPCRPEACVDVPDEEDWLFDANRDYLEQMAAYKAYKKEEGERKAIVKNCEECGISYEAKRKDSQFCSQRCQDRARKKRQAAAPAVAAKKAKKRK